MTFNAIDRPCYALYTIQKDAELAKADKECILEEYMLKFKNKIMDIAKDSALGQLEADGVVLRDK